MLTLARLSPPPALRCKLLPCSAEQSLLSVLLTLPYLSLVSMDPVQSDLKRLGVKPADLNNYNIHMPPFPGLGLYSLQSLLLTSRK